MNLSSSPLQSTFSNRGPDEANKASLAASLKKQAMMAAKKLSNVGETQPGNPAAKTLATTLGQKPPVETKVPEIRAVSPDVLQSELTVEGLIAQWGESGGMYDLDKSGTVDMRDLVTLLARQQPAAAPDAPEIKKAPPIDPSTGVSIKDGGVEAPAPGATSTGTVADAPSTIDAKLATGDIAPNVSMPGPAPDGGTAAELTGTTDPTAAGPKDAVSILGGIMDAWGTDNAQYDLDGDGTVGMNDLLQALSDLSGGDDGVSMPAGLQDLLNAWGSGDATWDLDGDGTVGMSDLLQMLAGGSGDAESGPTVDGFSAAWGSDDPMYDLDGDGSVGMNDLLAFLADATSNGEATAPPNPDAGLLGDTGPEMTKDASAALGTTAPDNAVDRLKATLDAAPPAPTKSDPALGVTDPSMSAETKPTNDGPGELDPRIGLTTTNSYWGMAVRAAGDGYTDLATMAGLGDADVQAATLETPEQAAKVLASSIHERLSNLGFQDAPPSNLHEILDGLQLAEGDRKMVLDKLASAYPSGLGLSLTA